MDAMGPVPSPTPPEQYADISCSHCKRVAMKNTQILPPVHQDPDNFTECEWSDDMRESFAFVPTASGLPPWVDEIMTHSNWTKGKLYCPTCQLHIGSFNFTNEMRCVHCRQTFASSLYFLCGNVDISYRKTSSCTSPRSSSVPIAPTKRRPLASPTSVSPLHDPFHPDSPSISTLDLAPCDPHAFDENYDRISGELSLIRDPLHPDNLPEPSIDAGRYNQIGFSYSSPGSLSDVDDSSEVESPSNSRISSPGGHHRRYSVIGQDSQYSPTSGNAYLRRPLATVAASAEMPRMGVDQLQASVRRPLEHPEMVMRRNNSGTAFTTLCDSPAPTARGLTHSRNASNASAASSSAEEEMAHELAREYQCPICLEVMFMPVSCKPCHHQFCRLCLKTQACETSSVVSTTRCAVCRSYIHHVVFLEELARKLQESFPASYKRRSKNQSAAADLDCLPLPGFHGGNNSYQICCCIAYIHASKHRKKYMAVLQALLYFVVIGLPIFTLIVATVFSQ